MLAKTFTLCAGLAALAQAYTQPKGDPTWGPLQTPDLSSNVVRGEKFTITWDPENNPTDGVTVTLVLCKGPGSNCQLQPDAIAENLPAAQKSFQWYVPCELSPGTAQTATGYGMAVIVDQTGEYQYSTQFSIQEGDACSVAPTNSASPSAALSTYATVALPTGTGSQNATFTTSTQSIKSSSNTVEHATSTTGASSHTTTSAVAVSSTQSASSTTNGAAAMATNAAGAMFAVGLALFAM